MKDKAGVKIKWKTILTPHPPAYNDGGSYAKKKI